jgi:hypothetical protein
VPDRFPQFLSHPWNEGAHEAVARAAFAAKQLAERLMILLAKLEPVGIRSGAPEIFSAMEKPQKPHTAQLRVSMRSFLPGGRASLATLAAVSFVWEPHGN